VGGVMSASAPSYNIKQAVNNIITAVIRHLWLKSEKKLREKDCKMKSKMEDNR